MLQRSSSRLFLASRLRAQVENICEQDGQQPRPIVLPESRAIGCDDRRTQQPFRARSRRPRAIRKEDAKNATRPRCRNLPPRLERNTRREKGAHGSHHRRGEGAQRREGRAGWRGRAEETRGGRQRNQPLPAAASADAAESRPPPATPRRVLLSPTSKRPRRSLKRRRRRPRSKRPPPRRPPRRRRTRSRPDRRSRHPEAARQEAARRPKAGGRIRPPARQKTARQVRERDHRRLRVSRSALDSRRGRARGRSLHGSARR